MKTIVIGGYGNFGARICRALAPRLDIELVVAGRDVERASRLAKELGEHVNAMQLDVAEPDLAAILRDSKVELVIHTAGPFQQQSYGVALAVAAAGAHYIDLADGRRFVCDFPLALDAPFRQAGRIAITGTSTVPALSAAVVDYLTEGWQSIHSIDSCIAPAQTAPRGVATLASVLDYCGAPIQVWRNGAWMTRYGWEKLERIHFARLAPRFAALCEIPDLSLFPERYKGVGSVIFRAGLEINFMQRSLSVFAKLRRWGVLKQPEKLAGFLNSIAGVFDVFGSSLGGMVVNVKGLSALGLPIERSWHIAADHDHGPEIPCMAAILLARRLARKEIVEIGAHNSMGWLTIADFLPEFGRWDMQTDVLEQVI